MFTAYKTVVVIALYDALLSHNTCLLTPYCLQTLNSATNWQYVSLDAQFQKR